MTEIQSEMSPASRTFSKVIHNPAVEKSSEVIGNTVARPNAILSGSAAAFILTAGIYLVAKHFGYSLSGTETNCHLRLRVGYRLDLRLHSRPNIRQIQVTFAN